MLLDDALRWTSGAFLALVETRSVVGIEDAKLEVCPLALGVLLQAAVVARPVLADDLLDHGSGRPIPLPDDQALLPLLAPAKPIAPIWED